MVTFVVKGVCWLFLTLPGTAIFSCLFVVKIMRSFEPQPEPSEFEPPNEETDTSPLTPALISIIGYNFLMICFTLSNIKDIE